MVKKTCAAIGKNYFIRTYLRFSGTETGYGFFAPNVKSGGAVLAKINKNTIVPEFNSFEGTLRYNCLSSEILDYVYKKKNTTSKNIVKERYQELVLKNIATKLLNSNSTLSDSITVSFGIIKFPSLEEARQGMNVIPTLLKCKELKYSVRNEAAKF
jgi:hypothetical protein